jgi:hypothetical protein
MTALLLAATLLTPPSWCDTTQHAYACSGYRTYWCAADGRQVTSLPREMGVHGPYIDPEGQRVIAYHRAAWRGHKELKRCGGTPWRPRGGS